MPKLRAWTVAAVNDLRKPPKGKKQEWWFCNVERGTTLAILKGYGNQDRSIRGTHSLWCLSKGKRHKLGVWDNTQASLDRAKEDALKLKSAPDRPVSKTGTLLEVANDWLKYKVDAAAHRRASESRRIVENLIGRSKWANVPFLEMKQSDFTDLIRSVQQATGSDSVADSVHSKLFAICRWYQRTYDVVGYAVPITSAMKIDQRPMLLKARQRFLKFPTPKDPTNEISIVWRAAGPGRFGVLVKLLLLTGVRREKLATMQWTDVNLSTGVWTIPREPNEKGAPPELKLPKLAVELIRSMLHKRSDYVFGSRENKSFRGFGQSKIRLDERIAKLVKDENLKPLPAWTLHDLRRTFSTILNTSVKGGGLGVQPHIVELLLGHSLGFKGIYNVASYDAEFATALQKLADHIETLVTPPPRPDVLLEAAE